MNKGIVCLACVVVLGCSAAVSAQVTGGVKAGINFANISISGNGPITPDRRTAWMVGGFVEIPLARYVVFQPEAIYTRKGAQYSEEMPGTGTAVATVKLDYFDVPVLVRFDVPTTGAVVPFVYAGPNIGFLVSAKSQLTVPGTAEQEHDIKSDTSSTDFGMAFGGGVRFGRLTAEVRYVLGLTNVDGSATNPDSATIKNNVIKFIAGFRF